jgi:hypothetical protein
MKFRLGHRIYGLGAISLGLIILIWQQISSLGNISQPLILIYFVGIIEIIGGLALQWRGTTRYGTLALGAVYFFFTLYLIQFIIEMPLDYYSWGNFFEELSVALGSVIVFASTIKNYHGKATKIVGVAYGCYGLCVISYSLYQLFYLTYTANLVPAWIPAGQMFWAVATTIAFALAAYAILFGRLTLLATRLLTIMFISFCLLVWLPLNIKDPHNMSYWIGNAQTLAVAGTAWIVADFLSDSKTIPMKWLFGRVYVERNKV